MKKAISVFLFAVVILSISTPGAHAQVSFLLGAGAGAVLSGGERRIPGDVNGNVIYIAPIVSERVKDPLSVKFARYDFWDEDQNGMSLSSMFKIVEPNAEVYEVLEVTRVIKRANQGRAFFWFAYIEKKFIISTDLFRELYPKK